MDPKTVFCPNSGCSANGVVGGDNIGVHSLQEKRYVCHTCAKTFAATKGTLFYRLQYEHEFVSQMVSLLSFGCPPIALQMTYGLAERTIDSWQQKAEAHSHIVHQHQLQQGRLDLGQVQVDEIRGKIQGGIVWLAMAICVPTRLWLGGVVGRARNQDVLDRLAQQVKACALCRPLLICFDGLPGYKTAFQRAFRSPLRLGNVGRPRLIAWPDVALGQMVKQYTKGRVSGVTRNILQGTAALVQRLLTTTQGGGVIQTAYIERLNATFRSRLAALGRRTRHVARRPETLAGGLYLVGCVYNFCTYHHSLRRPIHLPGNRIRWVQRTPAMAAGLTDHCWTVHELLSYRVPPPPAAASGGAS